MTALRAATASWDAHPNATDLHRLVRYDQLERLVLNTPETENRVQSVTRNNGFGNAL